jgi:molybdopterin synthase catalytic subunit
MAGNVVIEAAPEALDAQALLQRLDTAGCGSIVSFVGITRDNDDGETVIALEFDAWQEELTATLRRLAESAIAEFGVHGVAMAHRTGQVLAGENIVAIHVASPHRREGFAACSWLIDELKASAPLWKKEVKASGETWKSGLG